MGTADRDGLLRLARELGEDYIDAVGDDRFNLYTQLVEIVRQLGLDISHFV